MSLQIGLKASVDIAGKAVTLVITVAAARSLVADAFGVLALAMATGWLIGVATDAGLSMFLARETARPRAGLRKLFNEVMVVRGGLAYLAAACVALGVSWFVPSHWRLQFLLVVLAQLSSAVLETVAHVFRGVERSEIESAVQLAQRGVTAAAALTVLAWQPRLDYLGAAMLAPPLVALAVAMPIASRLLGRQEEHVTVPGTVTSETQQVLPHRPQPLPDDGKNCDVLDVTGPGTVTNLTWRRFATAALPLGAGAIVSALYFRCDLYFVEHWHGLEAAGAYNAVFRVVDAARLVPAAVMAVTFPSLCRAADTRELQRIARWLAAAGVLVLAALAPFAPFVVTALYGDPFRHAALTLAVLALAVPLFFLNYALTHQVIAWDGQRAYLGISLAALAGNLVANLMLVPPYGMMGAAVATGLTEIIVTVGCLVAIRAFAREPASGSAGSSGSPGSSGSTGSTGSAGSPSRVQELAVLQSVTYAALFDYPLTATELHDCLIGVEADETAIVRWWRRSPFLQDTIQYCDGFFYPRGRDLLPATRRRREPESRVTLQQHRRLLALVARMPFVRMVAISGSLAHLNADGAADLDLFVVTAPNRVWLVAVAVLASARVRGWRGHLCLNYVVSERRLSVAPEDLFSANQIIHLRPVTGDAVYRRFLDANPFVASWYPNFRPRPIDPAATSFEAATWSRVLERFLQWTGLAALGERASRRAYGWHLRRRAHTWQSADQVRLEPECLKLHTSSHRAGTLARFEAAMARALAGSGVSYAHVAGGPGAGSRRLGRRDLPGRPRPAQVG